MTPETVSLQLEINPEGIDDEYLRCLNTCFPNWGDEQVSDWVFHRALPPDPPPDRFVLRENGEPLAGSAVSYRSVGLPNGNTIRAGIMTGSWTLPAARGRGCFTQMIETSISITREREGALLLAFVTEDNPSRRQLEKAGAALIPTSYLIAENTLGSPAPPENPLFPAKDISRLFQSWQQRRAGRCHFTYTSLQDWKGQFADRPWQTEVVQNSSGSFAILEKHTATTRINALSGILFEEELSLLHMLRAQAQAEGRKLFLLSTDAVLSAACKLEGFTEKQGFLTAMVTDWPQLGRASGVSAVPGSPANSLLADPSSPWYLGQWELQSGDRM